MATTTIPTATAKAVGISRLRRTLSVDVLRQESNGPTAVSKSSNSATGMLTLLKNGAPTVTLLPCTHSERTGKRVPHKTVKHATSNSRLLKRKLDSRETSDSNRFSLRRWERLRMRKNVQAASTMAMKMTNQ